MSASLILFISLGLYLLLLYVISSLTKGKGGNDDFFRAGRQSSWTMVAFGMIGASISGVSFVSVPGWVGTTGMTYLQMCMGFVIGYAAVAFILLPVYYRTISTDRNGSTQNRPTSIYSILCNRLGIRSQKTGAAFFLLSKLTGAAARLYLAVVVLTNFLPPVFTEQMGVATDIVVAATILLIIFAYTRRGGIRTIVRTDALQTACMLLALVGIFLAVAQRLDFGFREMVDFIRESPYFRIFDWDMGSRQTFWRQFLSGIFIVIVMTGLDQDMMQKSLTCKSLREAQKNMCSYGIAFLPINFLLLALGILLYGVCSHEGLAAPARTDDLLPSLVAGGTLGTWVVVPFSIGICAAAFSSADSALTALTTSFCIDILGIERKKMEKRQAERTRKVVHLGVIIAFLLCIGIFRMVNNSNIIDTIYVMASYSYGPLLGIFAFALYTRHKVQEAAVPYIAVTTPIICGLLDHFSPTLLGYTFGYELLMLNGLLTFAGLMMVRKKKGHNTD